MDYSIATSGAFWGNGIFNVPKSIVDNYIKLASEYQLKALLIILSSNGIAASGSIAKALGITENDVKDIMQFWVSEGIIASSENEQPLKLASLKQEAPLKSVTEKKAKPSRVEVNPPALTPRDIVRAAEENKEIGELLNEAQRALGRTISHSEEEMLVNLVNFYGMQSEIILMILGYCKVEAEKGKKISTSYILKIAQNWVEEGIETIADAEEKLLAIEQGDKLWKEITALAGIRHRKPTQKQREMIAEWSRDFSFVMISLAIEEMKNNTPSPSLPYADKILKNWKKAGIATPEAAERAKQEFAKSRSTEKPRARRSGEVTSKPSYDLEKIKNDARNNTDIKY